MGTQLSTHASGSKRSMRARAESHLAKFGSSRNFICQMVALIVGYGLVRAVGRRHVNLCC